MTLIAATSNTNSPMLVGDLLVSSKGQTKSIKTPSHFTDISEYLDQQSTQKATGLYQKIYVITPKVAVALAGDVEEMRKFLKELKMRCSYFPELDNEKVDAFLTDIKLRETFTRSAFLLLWIETGEGSLLQPMQKWGPGSHFREIESILFGEVVAAGSGASSFLSRVQENNKLEVNTDRGEFQKAITQNLILVGTLLAAERTTLYNINELWGAGFELILYRENGFEKFADHTFVLVEGTIDQDGSVSRLMPKIAQNYRYYEGTLLISAIELLAPNAYSDELDEIWSSTVNNESIYFIPSLDSAEEFERKNFPHDFSFSSQKVIFGYSVIFNDESVIHPGVYFESNEQLVFYTHKHDIVVHLPHAITEKVRKGIDEFLDSARPS